MSKFIARERRRPWGTMRPQLNVSSGAKGLHHPVWQFKREPASICREVRSTIRSWQLCLDFYMIEAKPDDSDPLDDELRLDGIEKIAPHRANSRKPLTQDRRRLSCYMRRWLVERGWIQWQRGILVRWEYHTQKSPRLCPARPPRFLFRQSCDRF
jgi:hypothetical protein